MLEDGRYDAIVFDADDAPEGGVVVELTVLTGEHKGVVLSITASEWAGDPIDLLGIPATVEVADGEPVVTFEP